MQIVGNLNGKSACVMQGALYCQLFSSALLSDVLGRPRRRAGQLLKLGLFIERYISDAPMSFDFDCSPFGGECCAAAFCCAFDFAGMASPIAGRAKMLCGCVSQFRSPRVVAELGRVAQLRLLIRSRSLRARCRISAQGRTGCG
jgi:hypothetical protein